MFDAATSVLRKAAGELQLGKQRRIEKRWNDQHVASVGQGKIPSLRRKSKPRPCVRRSVALTTELLLPKYSVIFVTYSISAITWPTLPS